MRHYSRRQKCADNGARQEAKRRGNEQQKALADSIPLAQKSDDRDCGNEFEDCPYYCSNDAE